METYDLFRISLVPRRDDLLTVTIPPNARILQIKKSFERDFVFQHRKKELHFRALEKISKRDVILAKIGRAVTRIENLSPEEGFEEHQTYSWVAAKVFIDALAHADGQKMAVQRVNEVGNTISTINSLTSAINEFTKDDPYEIVIESIPREADFWAFVEQNKSDISYLELDFVTPNMFGLESEINEFLKERQKDEGADRVKLAVHGARGLTMKTKKVEESVKYISKSGGRIRARTRNKRRYDSKDSKTSSKVAYDRKEDESLVEWAARALERVFGRE